MTQDEAECLIFTYKAGLLSAVAHDLRLRVTDWKLEVDSGGQSVSACFRADSIVVDGAMQHDRVPSRGGGVGPRLAEDAMSESDKEAIRANLRKDVLHPDQFPEIRFRSSSVQKVGVGYDLEGELTLHGATRPLRLQARQVSSSLTVDVMLSQPDFGIKPYSAMLGALKIKPEVRVKLRVPLPPPA